MVTLSFVTTKVSDFSLRQKNQCKNIVNAEDEEMLKFSRRLKFEIEVEVAAKTKVMGSIKT